jgi:L-ribulose-5-phosphate 3-epimerase
MKKDGPVRLSTSMNMLFGHGNDAEIETVITRLNLAGYHVLDFNACDYANRGIKPEETLFTSDRWQPWVERMARCGEKLGVAFNQCHNVMYNFLAGGEQTEWLERMTVRAFEACAMLGIEVCVCHPVPLPGSEGDIEACRKSNREYFLRMAEAAARHGVTIAIENMFITRWVEETIWRYCSTPGDLVALVDSIGLPNVRICLDVGHAHIMGESWEETVSLYGSRLAALHIQDNDRHSDQHVVPYQGTIDWSSAIAALARHGYAGDWTLEVHNETIRMPRELQDGFLRQSYLVGKRLVEMLAQARAA